MGGSEHTKDREMRRCELDFEQEEGFGWMPKEKGTWAENGRTSVSNVSYSDSSKCFISKLELPSLFLHRVSEKHSSPSFPLQFVEGPSQG